MLAISWQGDVCLCSGDINAETSLGRVYRDASIMRILQGSKARAVLRGFARGRIVHPHCRICLGGPSRLSSLLRGVLSPYVLGYWLQRHGIHCYRFPWENLGPCVGG